MKGKMLLIMLSTILNYGCSNFLDIKPDVKMVVPKTLDDAELLLKDYNTMNTGYPCLGEIGTDQYYLGQDEWNAISNEDQRNAYHWQDMPYQNTTQWEKPYKTVYLANQVIDLLGSIDKGKDQQRYERIMGVAYFFRAFVFSQLAEVYAPAYHYATAGTELGIPLRIVPGIDEHTPRASLKDTYQQVIKDFSEAINLLPEQELVVGHPYKASAYAGAARVFLNMGDYENAFLYAHEALKRKPQLMDYNELNPAFQFPISRNNIEVLFSAVSALANPMSNTVGFIDSTLVDRYETGDLRKRIFLNENTDHPGKYNFKGSYNATSGTLFVGLTSSEMYLVHAESAARTGRKAEALESINVLRKSRWDKNTVYTEITEQEPEALLEEVLAEREKELLFRGRRWADLKRLNLDNRFQKTLIRKINNTEYKLLPNSLLYAFRLPEPALIYGGIPQNKR